MIDNTHVVVLQGTGAAMIPVPEMEAFAERFGFVFRAHEMGHANRSARVERNFDYIENNFLAGREFKDWEDLNQQARAWCEKVNAHASSARLHAAPRDLFAQERTLLRPLPIWVPTGLPSWSTGRGQLGLRERAGQPLSRCPTPWSGGGWRCGRAQGPDRGLSRGSAGGHPCQSPGSRSTSG